MQTNQSLYDELKQFNTLGELLNHLFNKYDLNKPIPAFWKSAIITGLITAINWVKPNLK